MKCIGIIRHQMKYSCSMRNLPVSIKANKLFPEKFSSSLKIPITYDSWLFASKDQVVKAVDLDMIALLLQVPRGSRMRKIL